MSSTSTNAARPIACGLLVAALAYQIASLGISDYLVGIDPKRAIRWDHSNATAYTEVAKREFAAKDYPETFAWAQRALEVAPLAPFALPLLATAALATGKTSQGDALMHLANRSSREPLSKLWLFNNDLRSGDYAGAMLQADMLLRQPLGGVQTQVLPLLVRLASIPTGRAAIAETLRQRPPWRESFVTQLSTVAPRAADVLALSAALRDASTPLEGSELRALENRLLKDGKPDDAYAEWQANASPGKTSGSNLLFNGDFKQAPSGSAFDWTVTPISGAAINLSAGELRIAFLGSRVPFRNVSHLLALKPGNYFLAGEVQTTQLQSAIPLQWKLSCLSPPADAALAVNLPNGTTSWGGFEKPFTLGASCRGQTLVLELPAKFTIEQQISGSLSIRNLVIRSR